MTVPLYSLTDTWNASGTTWKGILLNVTDTGHAAASRLLDLQVGGTTQFDVDATGTLGFASDVQINVGGSAVLDYGVQHGGTWTLYNQTGLVIGSSGGVSGIRNNNGVLEVNPGSAGQFTDLKARRYFGAYDESAGYDAFDITNAASGGHHWQFGDGSGSTSKGPFNVNGAFCFYDLNSAAGFSYGSNVFAVSGGASAQSLHAYNTYTDSSNYERGVFDWATTSNVLTIGAQAAGTGTLRAMKLIASDITVQGNTATPAGGSTSARLLFGTTAGFGIYYGSGAPTVSAAAGSLYIRTDNAGANLRLYSNTTGSTTWAAITSA